MSSTYFTPERPISEAEFLTLGEISDRIELFDGTLHVTPAPTPRHQAISRRLANALDGGAEAAGLYVHEAVNVRLRPNRIPIPDLVVTELIDFDELVIDAEAVRFVCEIVSPSNASADRVVKMHYYATAGIPWYLLVEPETCALHLFQLKGSTYVEHSVTEVGEVLHLSDPVSATIVPENLLPPRR